MTAKPLLVGTPRRGVRGGLGETALPGAYLACVRTFTERAETPTLPTVLRIKHAIDSHTPGITDYGFTTICICQAGFPALMLVACLFI